MIAGRYTLEREIGRGGMARVYAAEAPFYTMELLPGMDVESGVPLPWQEAADILTEVACALAVIHSRRLLPRDISSANVRRTADGQPKLIDFGAMVSAHAGLHAAPRRARGVWASSSLPC